MEVTTHVGMFEFSRISPTYEIPQTKPTHLKCDPKSQVSFLPLLPPSQAQGALPFPKHKTWTFNHNHTYSKLEMKRKAYHPWLTLIPPNISKLPLNPL